LKEYLEFTEEDFVLDRAFQRWVENPDEASNRFWSSFLEQYPDKGLAITNARNILNSFRFTDDLSFAEKQEMWKNIKGAIQKEKEGKVVLMHATPKKAFNRVALFVAAILLGCVVFAGIKMIKPASTLQADTATAATRYGEIKKLKLPDSSIITLNAHSQVRYNSDWDNSKREVWVEGEAYFSIKHTSTNQPFIVHTNLYDIEVLGTEFNVSQRRDRIKISLNSGKIRLKTLDGSNGEVIMLPGELLERSVKGRHFQKKPVKVENISAWKEGKLLFDDTPLAEVIETMKDTYGWEIAKVDVEILNKELSGEVDTRDEEELIHILEKALQISIKREGTKVYISRL
jgi:ferric-dicitrate binding protein FerR (iron transport regulator)